MIYWHLLLWSRADIYVDYILVYGKWAVSGFSMWNNVFNVLRWTRSQTLIQMNHLYISNQRDRHPHMTKNFWCVDILHFYESLDLCMSLV